MRRLSIRFEGQVQGVGFRWTSARIAQTLGATGWVHNEPDGAVSMELQGSSDQIATFFGLLDRAWGNYPIRYVIAEKDDIAVLAHETDFRVRR